MSTQENSNIRKMNSNTTTDSSEDAFMSGTDDANYPGPIVSRIEELILKNGIHKRQVRKTIVEITGITKPALVKWFSGDTTHPALQHLISISDFYNTSLEWLAKGDRDLKDEDQRQSAMTEAVQEATADGTGTIIFNSPVMHNLTVNQPDGRKKQANS